MLARARRLCYPACIMRRILVLCISLLYLVSVVACRQEESITVDLEPTPLLSAGIGYGVVNLAWVRLKAEPSHSANDTGFVRRQDVLELTARVNKSGGRDAGVWYRVRLADEEGWIHQSLLTRYDSRQRAEYYSGRP